MSEALICGFALQTVKSEGQGSVINPVGVLLLYMKLSSLVGFHQSPCRTSDSGKFFLRSYHVRVK